MEGMGPKPRASVFIIAAPVGVVSSKGMEDEATGTPFKISIVAGAGIGILPCMVSAVPEPSGTGEQKTVTGCKDSTARAAPMMSIMESIAPTSWKWTSSALMPCTFPSASAISENISVLKAFTPSVSALPSIIAFMSAKVLWWAASVVFTRKVVPAMEWRTSVPISIVILSTGSFSSSF